MNEDWYVGAWKNGKRIGDAVILKERVVKTTFDMYKKMFDEGKVDKLIFTHSVNGVDQFTEVYEKNDKYEKFTKEVRRV